MDEPNAGPEKHTTYREAVATRHMGSQSQQLPRLPLRLVVGLSEMLFFFLMTVLFVLQDLSSPTRD